MMRRAAALLLTLLLTPGFAGAFDLFGFPYDNSDIPVPVSASSSMAPQCPNNYNPYISAGTSWNQVSCSRFWFKKRGVRNRDPFVCDGFDHLAFEPLDEGVLAVTSINCFGGSRETGIAFNSEIRWSCSGQAAHNEIDVETVALHEFGHMLGLGHSDDNTSIMFPVYQGTNRSLGPDDVNGVCFLYPKSNDLGGEDPDRALSGPEEHAGGQSQDTAGEAPESRDGLR